MTKQIESAQKITQQLLKMLIVVPLEEKALFKNMCAVYVSWMQEVHDLQLMSLEIETKNE